MSHISLKYNLYFNAASQAVSMMSILIIVPMYLQFWGLEKYGNWIYIFSISSYFSIIELGYANVVGNRLAIIEKKNKRSTISIYYTTSIYWSLFSALLCIILNILTAILVTKYKIYITNEISQNYFLIIFTAFGSYIGLGFLISSFGNAFRLEEDYHYITAINCLERLTEMTLIIILLLLKQEQEFIISFMVFNRLIFLALTIFLARAKIRKFKLLRNSFKLRPLRSLFSHSMWYSFFTFSNLLNSNFIVPIIGYLLGSSAIVIYTTHRTMSGIVSQIGSILTNSIIPALTHLYSKRFKIEVYKIIKKSIIFSSLLNLLLGSLILYSSSYYFDLWLKKIIPFNEILLIQLIIIGYFNMLWQIFSSLAMSINKNKNIALAYFFTSISNFLLIYLISFQFTKLEYIATVFILTSFAMLAFTFYDFLGIYKRINN